MVSIIGNSNKPSAAGGGFSMWDFLSCCGTLHFHRSEDKEPGRDPSRTSISATDSSISHKSITTKAEIHKPPQNLTDGTDTVDESVAKKQNKDLKTEKKTKKKSSVQKPTGVFFL